MGELEKRGVSANFCEAILGIEGNIAGGDLEIEFHFSPLVAVGVELSDRILLPATVMSAIREIGEKLKIPRQEELQETESVAK